LVPDPETPARLGRYRIAARLGRGGFGVVYKAYDEELRRDVAVKVPHCERIGTSEDAEVYLAEARVVAGLDHPNIVPVFDLGRTEDGLCFVVSKFIEGSSLAEKIATARPPWAEAAALTAAVAEALHHAHKRGLVHRDVKPGNILLNQEGKPFLADFGLALQEADFGKGGGVCGTPAYMSPEQANGEGHRVDGRSDVFSLGVTFYELLTGKRPFRGEMPDILDRIIQDEPQPPRQIDDAIPKELERICLKALAKRASGRYTTALDFADDLRHFLGSATDEVGAASRAVPGPSRLAGPTPPTPPAPPRIVPKGLRAFDAGDADYFLELLPGPRDRDGLPDSIRFWKTRIEDIDPDNTFTVGLIYGPSGCGKSSLVKAGLLPRLSERVIAVYVEATANETESRLLHGLRKRFAELAPLQGLRETINGLRRGVGVPAGRKLLIVLDQFEQWLHARKDEQNPELVQALRQCDGERVQCVVMVRDDFWLAVSRFVRELEVDLVPGRNIALVDLFDRDHARKVLTAFGVAFGKLPEKSGEVGAAQEEFLRQAVAGLSQEGKVICVRLALFAEMMKARPWTPAALKEVGGTEGVGVAFLEDTFSSPTANPRHRLHQKAARAVLAALLPEAGTRIKGHMRSDAELLAASGYAGRPHEFGELLRILDGEVRLITPTDPAGVESEPGALATGQGAGAPVAHAPGSEAARHYQLTHDYLVPALRDWLTRKQKETRRGRAGLLLADRAAVWNARPENRQLPSLLQWWQIRWRTNKKTWTEPQRKMMRKAARVHAVRASLLTAAVVLVALLGREVNGRVRAQALCDRLLVATTADVPGIVREMEPYRRWVNPLLREAHARAEEDSDSRKRLHTSIALYPVDPGQQQYLLEQMFTADPEVLGAIMETLDEGKGVIMDPLWAVLEDGKIDRDGRFRITCALASFDPESPRWEKVRDEVAAKLVTQDALIIRKWVDAFARVKKWLLPPLAEFLEDEKRSAAERGLTAKVYGVYAPDVPGAYARLEKVLAEPGPPDETVEAKLAREKRQANVAVALVVMGRPAKAWPLLKHGKEPTRRSLLIERLAPGGADPLALVAAAQQEKDVAVRRALLLSLGQFGPAALPAVERKNLLPQLLRLYQDDPDPGIHGAAEWLVRLWGHGGELRPIDRRLRTGKPVGERGWYVNGQGLTMVIVPTPGEFVTGEQDPRFKYTGEEQRRRRISRTFAIASKEVTVEQFLAYRRSHQHLKMRTPSTDCPVDNVTWYDAAGYCNWLSEKEGVPQGQWCYVPNKEGKYAKAMRLAPDYLHRTGYRLPTEAEWEYACRAGAATRFAFGEPEELLGRYAWFTGNNTGTSHPVGMLKPNDLGLFDMHGNVWEWCLNRKVIHGAVKDNAAAEDGEDESDIKDNEARTMRGGGFDGFPAVLRTAFRGQDGPSGGGFGTGFRPARSQ
jgi:serine/threonine protein kinase/formylglycine-generating enzyme required for sulfatase activity